MGLFRDLFLAVDGRKRTLGRIVACWALASAGVLAMNRLAPPLVEPPLNDGHALVSLDLALARVFCGTPSSLSLTYRISYDLRDHITDRGLPLRRLAAEQAGGLEAYCRSVTLPFVNNENSLMLIESGLLRLYPNLSLDGLADKLAQIRLGLLFVFLLAMISAGMSAVIGWANAAIAVMLLRMMRDFWLSTYPFFFVLILTSVAVYVLSYRGGLTVTSMGRAGVALTAGILSGIGTNMRSSHLPVYAALFMASAGLILAREVARGRHGRGAVAAAWQLLALVIVFAASHLTWQYFFITRALPADADHAASSHSIAHPLVLGLALPENTLSRREGIVWLDESGLQLARRVDPTSPYLGPRYEAALYKFYVGLWRKHPVEMAGVYFSKAKIAGADAVLALRNSPGRLGRLARILLLPMRLLPNGLWLLGMFVIVTVAAARRFLAVGSPFPLALTLLGTAAILIYGESAAIYSFFSLNYHAYLAFFLLFLSLVAVQWVLNVVLGAIAPLWSTAEEQP